MKQNKRHNYILDKLERNNLVEVQEIVNHFQVSPITARRDLMTLEEEGLLVRTHGGAVKSAAPAITPLFSFNEKSAINQEQKIYICGLAASLINDGDTIFMDNGSTIFHLCPFLKNFKKLIVITNSLPVAADLLQYENIKVNLIGGEVDNERKAVFGYFAETMLENYHADKAFIGCDGISLQKGLTAGDEKEASISGKIGAMAENIYLLCDSSKFEKNAYIRVAPLSLIDILVTDKGIDTDLINAYKKHYVKIIN